MDAELLALHIERLSGLSNAFKAFGDGPANTADVAALDYAIERLSVAQGQGFVMVPREPTYQMAEAMGVKWESGEGFPRRYTAMLAAAPAQPDGVE